MCSLAKETGTVKSYATLPSGASTNKRTVAEDFNSFFVSIGPDTQPSICPHDQANTFHFSLVTAQYVERQIKQMDSNVATGVDGLSCGLLKATCPAVCTSISHFIT